MASSYLTMEALRVVLGEARAPALEEARREMERARMMAEDYAQGGAHVAPGRRTWRARDALMRRAVGEAHTLIVDIATAIDGVRSGVHTHEAAVDMIDDMVTFLITDHVHVRMAVPDDPDEPEAAAAPALEPALDEGALDHEGALEPTPDSQPPF